MPCWRAAPLSRAVPPELHLLSACPTQDPALQRPHSTQGLWKGGWVAAARRLSLRGWLEDVARVLAILGVGLLPISCGPLCEPRRAEGGRGTCRPTWGFQVPELSHVGPHRCRKLGEVTRLEPQRRVLGVGGRQGPAGHHLPARACFLAGLWPPRDTPSSSLSKAFLAIPAKASVAPDVLSGALHDSSVYLGQCCGQLSS